MKQLSFCFLLCLVTLLFSCKKNTGSGGDTLPPPGQLQLPHGNPIGEIATVSIGPAGGSLKSKDGTLQITVPAGTVNSATNFSIQEVENVLENSAKTYRLLPENIVFEKPITITYHYGKLELGGANPDFLFLAFQDKEGYFFSANQTRGDRQKQTLTVTTTHFSDWTFFAEHELTFPSHSLTNGELLLLQGESADIILKSTTVDKKQEVSPLTEATAIPLVNKVAWDYSPKKGTLTKLNGQEGVTYQAPATVAARERVYLNTTINGNLGTDNLGSPVQQIQIRLPIVIEPEGYFMLSVNGAEMTASSFSGLYIGGFGSQFSALFLEGYALNCYTYYNGIGGFPYGEHGKGAVAAVELSEISDHSYLTLYAKNCDKGGEAAFSTGSFNVKSVANQKGEYFEGEFSCTVYHYDYCKNGRTKSLSGKFRFRKLD